MLVRHLDCATMCPVGGQARFGGSARLRSDLVGHCLVLETDDGLVLVDTGFGTEDVADARRLGFGVWPTLRPVLTPERTALHQLIALGYRREDVRHIVLTHLDLDHAGGLADFPGAEVHIFTDELAAATRRRTIGEKLRYRPGHWAHGPKWRTHDAGGEDWFGFTAVPILDDIMLVPLIGHSRGHCGVAVRRGAEWLLHCGDAYFHRYEVHPSNFRPPLELSFFERISGTLTQQRLANLARLRALHIEHGAAVRLFCAHDPEEFRQLRNEAATADPSTHPDASAEHTSPSVEH
ncbi:MBL fold metallo-hydrolase [Nocardia callitridis]|uniref:MBL fold metallo-hydrolase n=1 Tax=Nocardia callitridis TaxID=648753 RepID=A0ABP9K349_9NOCA